MARIGNYLLDAKLGEGGMATVFRAVHAEFGVPVALKVLLPRYAETARASSLLMTEVAANARMRHPNIVNVLDVDTVSRRIEVGGQILEAGQPYFVMELVNGPSLDRVGAMRWIELKQLLLHVLEGLAHAHARDVIHRDLKPANVILDLGPRGSLPKISDFGIARLDVEEVDHNARELAGTPVYMAPSRSKDSTASWVRGPISTRSAAWPTSSQRASSRSRGRRSLNCLRSTTRLPFPGFRRT